MNDVRKMIYGTLVGFLMLLGLWFSIIFVSACGYALTCNQAAPLVERTPIATLIPHARSNAQLGMDAAGFNKCQVAAQDLIGAWVAVGHPEVETFPFTDVNGGACEGTFADDIQPLFVENSLWYPGSIGCVSCHNGELSDRSAGLDLTSYEAISLGAGRVAETTSPGADIFGGGDWEKSLLYEALVNRGLVPDGHSGDAATNRVVLYAGRASPESIVATPTP